MFLIAHLHFLYILASDSIYALRAIYYRPSVRHTGGLVKNVWSQDYEIFTVRSSPSLVSRAKFHPDILSGPPERVRETREGWGNKPFSSFKRQYLENGRT